jgi:hypothetical protein
MYLPDVTLRVITDRGTEYRYFQALMMLCARTGVRKIYVGFDSTEMLPAFLPADLRAQFRREIIERDVFENTAEEDEGKVRDKPFHGKYWNSAKGISNTDRTGGRKNLRALGGGRHTESAVLMGLVWLKNHQNPNGMWSCKNFMMNCQKGTCAGVGGTDDYDMGCTGLALLAFLGAGHTHKHGKFKNTVKKTLKALKDRQTPDGCFGPKSKEGHWIYNHAMATMAMAEAYGLSNKSPLLQGTAQKAVDFLLDCQNPYLGWRYGKQTGENDSSVTSWATLALKSAKISGLHVPKESFDGALNWFDRVTDEAYFRTGYTTKGDNGSRLVEAMEKFQPSDAMTAAALACRIFILESEANARPEILGAGNLLKNNPPKWEDKAGTIDMYYWYYGTLAMFQLGRQYWKAWNEPMKNALVPTQQREGCQNGSWDPIGAWGTAGGRVYSTAINCLSLEIYYRYGRVLKKR